MVTGCYVTASDYTTGEYCVSGVTVLSDDDRGQVGILTIHTGSLSTTLPESAVVSGTAYTPTSGTIVVSGRTLTIPVVTSITTEVVGGETVIIVPKATVKVAPSTTSSSTSTTTTTPAPEATLGVEGYSGLLGGTGLYRRREQQLPLQHHRGKHPLAAGQRALHRFPFFVGLYPSSPRLHFLHVPEYGRAEGRCGDVDLSDLPTKVSCPPTEGTYSCIAGAHSLSFTALFHCHLY